MIPLPRKPWAATDGVHEAVPAARASGLVRPRRAAVDAIRCAARARAPELWFYSAAPYHEIEEAARPVGEPGAAFHADRRAHRLRRGVRHEIWMSLDWPDRGGRQDHRSIPRMSSSAFELTILLGRLSTVTAVALLQRADGKARHRL